MRQRRASWAVAIALVAAAFLASAAAAATPEEELAERYAPVVRLVEQVEECGHGEPYEPIDVTAVLENEDVALRGPWDRTNVVKVGPTADDLATGKYEYHLDFPGDALNPGCDYERWSRRLTDARPTVYARVVGEDGAPGEIALQYWFFYVFNDYNNKHEGDWEMVQLVFDAPDAGAALETAPSRIGYSQHSGAEAADWGDDKLEIVGETHPVVYPAAGSHANYFEPALFLGRSAAEGVGCDDTNGPSRDLRPQVALIPTDAAAYGRTHPWLRFDGRWGEKQKSFYNGPTGPNDKRQWTEPISWADDTFRDSSFAVPAGGLLGTEATDFFCDAVAAGSNLLTRATENPTPVLIVLAGLVVLALWAVSRTEWHPSAPLRLGRRRAWGQLLTASRRMYRRRWRLFALIGVGFIPVGVVIALAQTLVLRVADLGVGAEGESNSVAAALALALGLLFTFTAVTIVQAITARAMAEIDADRPVSALGAFRLAFTSGAPLVGALVIAAAVIFVLDLTVIGIPIAAWLAVRWSLVAQVIELEGERRPYVALRRSAELVRGHWLRVASITAAVALVLLLGPLVGALLLLVSSASFAVVNVVAGLVYAAVMPFVAIATTYLYFDLRVRDELEPRAAARHDVLPAEIA
jgi:hypothetical protein